MPRRSWDSPIRSRPAQGLVAATGVHAPSLARLVRAPAALGVVAEADGDCVELTPPGATVRPDVPGSVRDAVVFLVGEWCWRGAWGAAPVGFDEARARRRS